MPIRHGALPQPIAIRRGRTVIREVRRGGTLVWSSSAVRDCFDLDGWLQGWIDEMCDDPAHLIPDGLGYLFDGLDNAVGSLVGYTNDAVNQTGILVANTANSAVDAYCGMWGGSAPDGLLGLINGLPLIGGPLKPFVDILEDWFGGTLEVDQLIGKIPVVGQLAQNLGLIPDKLGNLLDPINYVIDEAGNVIGTITCGAYKDIGGVFEPLCFVIGQVAGAARMLIPDGLMSLDLTTSRFRHPTVMLADDGYLELEVAEGGGPGVITQVFRRYSNDGSGAAGVGLDLRDRAVSIVRRVGGVDTLVKPNLATFGGGDKLRLVQTGNLHELFKNGEPVGSWNDAGATAVKAATARSIAMLMQGAQQFGGSRLFSPSLSCVEAA
ncbi:hypothetical protein PBI_INDLOVU_40 [Mycobacterium phage Indlovu]|nr:hypothetical protein PBI_INDLOVU_40 [Mycobacterium phage Indlovu]